MGEKKIKPEVGKRVLYQIGEGADIHEGIIEQVSPNGQYFKIDGKWFFGEKTTIRGGVIVATILDELQEVSADGDSSSRLNRRRVFP